MSNPTIPALQPPAIPDWKLLRARFKQAQASTGGLFQNWQIRIHRSLSWLNRAEQMPDDQPDLAFMLLWVSLNALYSAWDPERNAPAPDPEARRKFIARLDPATLGTTLHLHRPLVKKLLENFYLSPVFWRDPHDPANRGRATNDANYLDRNFKDKKYAIVLAQVLDRLYVLRGQLMHGAATGGGKLNRQSLKYAVTLLRILVPTILDMLLNNPPNDDWPDLCYPPVK